MWVLGKRVSRIVVLSVVAGLAVSGCVAEKGPPSSDGGGAPPPKTAADPSAAGRGVEAAGSRSSAEKAVALIQDNKLRCLDIAREGYNVLVEQRENREDTSTTFSDYIDVQAAPEIAVAEAVTETVAELLPKIGRETGPGVSSTLYRLHDAQRQLCEQAVYNWSHPDTYDRKIKESIFEFNEAEIQLPQELLLDSRQRSRALAPYREMMRDERMGAVRLRDSMTDADNWQMAGSGGKFDLTAEEYRRKQKEWEEHQQRMERERAQRDAQVRAQRQRRRQQQASEGRGELPRVGVSKTPPKPTPTRTQLGVARAPAEDKKYVAAKAWHQVYLDAAWPLRSALLSYTQIKDGHLLTQRRRACKTLSDSAKQALNHPTLVSPPEPAPKKAIETALRGFANMGAACRTGNQAKEDSYFHDAKVAWKVVGDWLEGFGLKP